MKFKYQVLLGLTSVLFSSLSYAKLGVPCSGVPGSYHTNPDSTAGGFVASTALVDSTVMIGENAAICGRATVIEGANIQDRSEVSGNAIIRGNVYVYSSAKIYGNAHLSNFNGPAMEIGGVAKIYGRALLQGSVMVTDDSEVFGWGKVLDFAVVGGGSKVCGSSIVKNSEYLYGDQSKCVQKK